MGCEFHSANLVVFHIPDQPVEFDFGLRIQIITIIAIFDIKYGTGTAVKIINSQFEVYKQGGTSRQPQGGNLFDV